MVIQKQITHSSKFKICSKHIILFCILLHLNTTRTKQKLRGITKTLNKNYQFYEWNCVDGLRKKDLNNGSLTPIENNEDPEQLLKFIAEQSEKDEAEIFILEDFHDFIEERNIKILLRQLAERLRFLRKHIIVVSSVLTLPIELEKYITVVELALPGRTDLEQVLLNVAKSTKVEIDDDLKKLIDAALGARL